ncbi:MAG: hypothetical protein ACK559_02000, partial [bacterium]
GVDRRPLVAGAAGPDPLRVGGVHDEGGPVEVVAAGAAVGGLGEGAPAVVAAEEAAVAGGGVGDLRVGGREAQRGEGLVAVA